MPNWMAPIACSGGGASREKSNFNRGKNSATLIEQTILSIPSAHPRFLPLRGPDRQAIGAIPRNDIFRTGLFIIAQLSMAPGAIMDR